MNRIDRLMATILLLQTRRVVTADQIASHFEISLRTVYRDIAALSEGGVPISAEAGVGYSLVGGYLIPPVMFTPAEAGALSLAGQLVEQMTDRSLDAEMRSALLKIRAVLPRAHQDQLDQLGRSTAFLLRGPSDERPSQAVLARLQEALARRRVVRLRYRTKGEGPGTTRELEPLGLLYYSNHWHLIGYCRLRQEFRDFRTDRMEELSVTHETFQPRPGISLQDQLECWKREFEVETFRVLVRQRSVDRFRRAWFTPTKEESAAEDAVTFTFVGNRGEWLTSWLLGFGTDLTVLEPESLRAELAQRASEWATHHQTPPPHPPHGNGLHGTTAGRRLKHS